MYGNCLSDSHNITETNNVSSLLTFPNKDSEKGKRIVLANKNMSFIRRIHTETEVLIYIYGSISLRDVYHNRATRSQDIFVCLRSLSYRYENITLFLAGAYLTMWKLIAWTLVLNFENKGWEILLKMYLLKCPWVRLIFSS